MNDDVSISLPRLVYWGDIPVERTRASSMLLYRLLEAYPPERLLILEPTAMRSKERMRLVGPEYVSFPLRRWRFLRTRFRGVVAASLLAFPPGLNRAAREAVKRFRPEALLSIAPFFVWAAAAGLAKRLGIPFHLIVHDEWQVLALGKDVADGWERHVFLRAYASAASRLCISESMEAHYHAETGALGKVLPPMRRRAQHAFGQPHAARFADSDGFTLGYGGSLFLGCYRKALAMAAREAGGLGMRTLVFSDCALQELEACAPGLRGVRCEGLVEADVLVERLHREADVLLVPSSFSDANRLNQRLLFPSKLVDYTAAGVALLVWGPADCAAVQWARQWEAAEIVTSRDAVEIRHALGKLRSDPGRRAWLARRAIEAGRACFSWESGWKKFISAVRPLQ